MTATKTAAERNQLRKSLLQVASLLLLTLLSTTLLALFSVWSLQHAHERNDKEVEELVSALDSSRQAQVHFKRQVQEWKNILLRGDFPVARARYFNAFVTAEWDVNEALTNLDALLIAAGENGYHQRLVALKEEHQSIGEKYRDALLDASGGHWAPFDSDVAVRGIDRPLNREIDQLAQDLLQASRERSTVLDREIMDRYHTLQTALWVVMVVSLLLVGTMLWRVLAERTAAA